MKGVGYSPKEGYGDMVWVYLKVAFRLWEMQP